MLVNHKFEQASSELDHYFELSLEAAVKYDGTLDSFIVFIVLIYLSISEYISGWSQETKCIRLSVGPDLIRSDLI